MSALIRMTKVIGVLFATILLIMAGKYLVNMAVAYLDPESATDTSSELIGLLNTGVFLIVGAGAGMTANCIPARRAWRRFSVALAIGLFVSAYSMTFVMGHLQFVRELSEKQKISHEVAATAIDAYLVKETGFSGPLGFFVQSNKVQLFGTPEESVPWWITIGRCIKNLFFLALSVVWTVVGFSAVSSSSR